MVSILISCAILGPEMERAVTRRTVTQIAAPRVSLSPQPFLLAGPSCLGFCPPSFQSDGPLQFHCFRFDFSVTESDGLHSCSKSGGKSEIYLKFKIFETVFCLRSLTHHRGFWQRGANPELLFLAAEAVGCMNLKVMQLL